MFDWLRQKPRPLIEYLTVKPDDAFVISTEQVLDLAQCEEIAAAVERFRRGELNTLVLEKGFRVTVVSR